jgi:tetratricopeptide (TPR) repeat protein
MISSILAATVALLVAPPTQVGAPDWQRASQYYLQGWSVLASEPIEAEKDFQHAISVYPDFPLAHYALGRSLMAQKRYSEALRAYLRSQELFRTQGSDRIAQQVGLLKRYHSSEVAQAARVTNADTRMTAQGPSRTTTATQMELQNQIDMLQQATQHDSRTSVVGAVPGFVALAVGSAYFRLNQLEDAEREYKRALEGDVKYGEAHNNLAVVYFLTERYDDAERSIKAAEKSGYRVSQGLKDDIKRKKAGG